MIPQSIALLHFPGFFLPSGWSYISGQPQLLVEPQHQEAQESSKWVFFSKIAKAEESCHS